MELGRLQSAKSAFDKEGIQIVAVSTDEPANLRLAREKTQAQFAFLSDKRQELISRFAIVHENGGPEGTIAQSASFLLDDEGRVIWSYVTDTYRIRKHPATVLTEINTALERRR